MPTSIILTSPLNAEDDPFVELTRAIITRDLQKNGGEINLVILPLNDIQPGQQRIVVITYDYEFNSFEPRETDILVFSSLLLDTPGFAPKICDLIKSTRQSFILSTSNDCNIVRIEVADDEERIEVTNDTLFEYLISLEDETEVKREGEV